MVLVDETNGDLKFLIFMYMLIFGICTSGDLNWLVECKLSRRVSF